MAVVNVISITTERGGQGVQRQPQPPPGPAFSPRVRPIVALARPTIGGAAPGRRCRDLERQVGSPKLGGKNARPRSISPATKRRTQNPQQGGAQARAARSANGHHRRLRRATFGTKTPLSGRPCFSSSFDVRPSNSNIDANSEEAEWSLGGGGPSAACWRDGGKGRSRNLGVVGSSQDRAGEQRSL